MATKGWRQVIADNQKKTNYVIGFFLLTYVFIGLLADIIFQSSTLQMNFGAALGSLITFQVVPVFTIALCLIGFACVWLTFVMHDKFMLWGHEYIEIDDDFLNTKPGNEIDKKFWLKASQLYNIIQELQIAARLQYMPKVFLIKADFMNAFASGYSEKSAMVAISEGLIDRLNRGEIQAVMAHELSHIKHMDIKLTLFIGVLTNIMLFAVDILSNIFYRLPLGDKKESGNAKAIATIIIFALRIFLPIITIILGLFLSRTREFMADAGSVSLTRDNDSLASALKKIHSDYEENDYDDEGANARKAAYIYNPFKSFIEVDFLSTHPSLEKRLAAMGIKNKREQE